MACQEDLENSMKDEDEDGELLLKVSKNNTLSTQLQMCSYN